MTLMILFELILFLLCIMDYMSGADTSKFNASLICLISVDLTEQVICGTTSAQYWYVPFILLKTILK